MMFKNVENVKIIVDGLVKWSEIQNLEQKKNKRKKSWWSCWLADASEGKHFIVQIKDGKKF